MSPLSKQASAFRDFWAILAEHSASARLGTGDYTARSSIPRCQDPPDRDSVSISPAPNGKTRERTGPSACWNR